MSTKCTLTFLVPLRPNIPGTDWNFVSQLAMNTLRSCLLNSAPEIRVIMIGHERPSGFYDVDDDRLSFAPAQTSVPCSTAGSTGMEDKWSKLFQGLVLIERNPPDYFMFVDADDLVSKRLYCHLRDMMPQNGLILKDGWEYSLGGKFIRYVPDTFNCGTNSVVATASVKLPKRLSPDDRASCIPLMAGHTIIERQMALAGKPLDRCPFPAAVHVHHRLQHSRHSGERSSTPSRKIKTAIKNALFVVKHSARYRNAERILLSDFAPDERIVQDC
ncbi:hypothetical protein [Roseitranquillus sediminis]|uniref:hypothetical protein n=1 Tax=Roseitranquillus sediminis TaxID=2809051 RepID=UPI001D0C58CB|nr:hypothetical protein [Roseitranquillus sediminis]MBM9594009.1 hypothetical protein [Roseitranquillus sediminis]